MEVLRCHHDEGVGGPFTVRHVAKRSMLLNNISGGSTP